MFTNYTFFVNADYKNVGYTIYNDRKSNKGGRHMKKSVNRWVKYSLICSIISAAWIFLTLSGTFLKESVLSKCQGKSAVVSFFQNLADEPQRELSKTSTGYRYEEKFQRTLKKYQQFEAMYEEELSTAVPGLEATNVLGSICDQMVPQGICIAGDYMLVTAYDNMKNYAQKTKQQKYEVSNSVLYVLSNEDPENRKLMTTIVLPDINHVGGVTFDGENVWIAKSTSRQCSMISYDVIEEAVQSGEESYQLAQYDQNVNCGAVASFISYHDDKLWIGTYSNRISGMGALRSYEIVKKDTEKGVEYQLVRQEELVIPGFANGVAFLESSGAYEHTELSEDCVGAADGQNSLEKKTYMAVSTSKGRYFDSKIYFYEIIKDSNTGKNFYHCYNSCKFPPMAEELVCDGENTYFLFESSATCYSTLSYQKCSYPVDRICALSTSDLFQKQQGASYEEVRMGLKQMQIPLTESWFYQEEKFWKVAV